MGIKIANNEHSTIARIAFLLFAILALILQTSCQRDTDSTNHAKSNQISTVYSDSLLLYRPAYSQFWFDPAVRLFRATYPEIEVIVEDVGFTDSDFAAYSDRVTTELAVGKGPDIIFTDMLYSLDLYKAMDNGVFTDISELIYQDKSFNREKYITTIFDSCLYKGHQYIIPFSFTFNSLVASQTKLDEIAFDCDMTGDISSLINEVARCVPTAKTASQSFKWMFSNQQFIERLFASSGIQLIDYESNSVLPDKANLYTFCEAYKRYFTYDQSDNSTVWSASSEDILSGKIVFTNPTSVIDTFRDASHLKAETGDFVAFPIRRFDGDIQFFSHNVAAIREGSPNQVNAYKFIMILLSADRQSAEVNGLVGYPVLKESLNKEIKLYREEYSSFNTYYSQSSPTNFTELSDEETQSLLDIILSVKHFSMMQMPLYRLFIDNMTPFFADERGYEDCLNELENKLVIYATE